MAEEENKDEPEKYDDVIDEVDSGDEEERDISTPKYQGEKDRKDRICFLFPNHIKAKTHWVELGESRRSYFCLAPKGQRNGPCCTAIGEGPKLKYGNVVIHYDVGKDLKPHKGSFAYEVKIYTFSHKKFKVIRGCTTLPKEQGKTLADFDLRVECEDTKWQKLEFNLFGQSLIKALGAKEGKGKQIYDEVMAQAKLLRAQLPREMAQKVSLDEIKAFMRGGDDDSVEEAGDIDALLGDNLE